MKNYIQDDDSSTDDDSIASKRENTTWDINAIKLYDEADHAQGPRIESTTGFLSEDYWTDYTKVLESLPQLEYLFQPCLTDLSIEELNETNNIYASTIVSIQNHTQNDDETTNTIRTFDETISIPWEPYNNMKSTSWDSYSPTDFDNNIYECNNVNHNLEQQEEEMKNRNQLPIISKEDLDIVAHTFYLRKKEMENVS